MHDRDIAWAAGIIDGEGCIRFYKNGNYFYPRLSVEMTHKPTIVRLHEILGGNVHKVKRNRAGRYERTLWVFEVAASLLGDVVGELYPYIFTKKEQFDLVMKYYQMKENKTGRYFSKDEVEYIAKMKELCSELKKEEFKD